jgi:hypothetical protein
MSKAVTPQRWFAAWRQPVRPGPIDPADLGTAFGLDQSLSELPHEALATAAVERRPGWVRRLTGRRKPAL